MIQVNNLTKNFGRLKALDNISVNFSKGECIAMLGPNGCGKTTFIKSLLGMIVPDRGEITINNQIITKNNWRYRSQIGYMPQIGRYPDNMSIADVINMMKDIRKKDSPNMQTDLLTRLGLDKIMHKKMRTLSGGTTQKVSAVLAFMFDPDILILDEPTAGLDPLSSERLKENIVEEKEKGKLILITSHILSELDDLITQVFYMQEGKMVFHKPLAHLFKETHTSKLSKAITQIMQ